MQDERERQECTRRANKSETKETSVPEKSEDSSDERKKKKRGNFVVKENKKVNAFACKSEIKSALLLGNNY